MAMIMTARKLNLSLQPGASVPCNLSWRVEDGYLRMVTLNEQAEPCTLALWGPGDLVIPSLITLAPLRLLSLSDATVQEEAPHDGERESFLLNQCLQTATLLGLTRSRPAELRLYQLLLWFGERFGRVSSRGVSLSLQDMNLTHRNLAEISGLTRVTVTKALSLYRQQGYLIKEGRDELMIREALPLLQRSPTRS
jgi:hypothetical protein